MTPATLRCAGHVLASLAGEYDQSLVLLQRAARLNPNSADIAATTGYLRYYAGQPAQAAASFERAIRLSPLDPRMVQIFAGLGVTSLMAGENEDALNFFLRSIHAGPDWTPTLRGMIFTFVRLGRIEEASLTARRLLEIDPGYRIGTRHLTAPKGAFRDEFLAALRLAGLSD